MKAPFHYETISPDANGTVSYRITDANDDRISTSYNEEHAQEIVRLMNIGYEMVAAYLGIQEQLGREPTPLTPTPHTWTPRCASGECSQCRSAS